MVRSMFSFGRICNRHSDRDPAWGGPFRAAGRSLQWESEFIGVFKKSGEEACEMSRPT